MRAIIRESWLAFTEPLEGGVACLYNDVRGKTTIAFGNLCDTPGEAAALPMVHPDGTFATTGEKIAAWYSVHDDPRCASLGWRYAATLTKLRLTREGMAGLALGRLEQNDRILLARLPEWESYPACAQMAMHSLAWACGPHAFFPRLFQAVQDRNFTEAAVQIHMNEWTPEGIHNKGLIPRNIANKILMRNAQRVDAYHLDPDTLRWEHLLGVDDEVTQPDLTSPPSSRPSAASQPTIHVDPGWYIRGAPEDPPDDAA